MKLRRLKKKMQEHFHRTELVYFKVDMDFVRGMKQIGLAIQTEKARQMMEQVIKTAAKDFSHG